MDDGQKGGWIDEQVGEWMDDGWINGCLHGKLVSSYIDWETNL